MPELLSEIFVEGLRITCIIGDLPRERTEPQEIQLNLHAHLDISNAIRSDSLEDSLDYVALANMATNIAQQGRYHLVEALAGKIAEQAMQRWPQLSALQVRIEKNGCIPNAEKCGVVHTLSRPSR